MQQPGGTKSFQSSGCGLRFWWHHSFIVFGNQLNKEDEALPDLDKRKVVIWKGDSCGLATRRPSIQLIMNSKKVRLHFQVRGYGSAWTHMTVVSGLAYPVKINGLHKS